MGPKEKVNGSLPDDDDVAAPEDDGALLWDEVSPVGVGAAPKGEEALFWDDEDDGVAPNNGAAAPEKVEALLWDDDSVSVLATVGVTATLKEKGGLACNEDDEAVLSSDEGLTAPKIEEPLT